MKKILDLDRLVDLMRRNSGHWMMLDEDGYRGRLSSRATSWKARPPKPFAPYRLEYRVRQDPERKGDRFVLWGRHVHATFPLDE
jgi:hypothetical protein